MAAHDGLDGLAGLVGIIEGDRADVMVKNVGFDDAVEELAPNEAKFTVDSGCCAASVCPGCGSVMRQSWVRVLKEGDSN